MPQPEMVANACKKPQRHQYHIQVALSPFHDDLDLKVSRERERDNFVELLNFLFLLSDKLFYERAICV